MISQRTTVLAKDSRSCLMHSGRRRLDRFGSVPHILSVWLNRGDGVQCTNFRLKPLLQIRIVVYFNVFAPNDPIGKVIFLAICELCCMLHVSDISSHDENIQRPSSYMDQESPYWLPIKQYLQVPNSKLQIEILDRLAPNQ